MWLVCQFHLSEIELNCVSVALYIISHDVCVFTHTCTICTVYMQVLEHEQDKQNKHEISGFYIDVWGYDSVMW
jgi:hypothetical protein